MKVSMRRVYFTHPVSAWSQANPVWAADNLAPTESKRGGSNNYSPGAPLVENLGEGFKVFGTVRQAGAGKPLAGAYLPSLKPAEARRWHKRLGATLVSGGDVAYCRALSD